MATTINKYSNMATDSSRFWRSHSLVMTSSADDYTYNLCKIPRFTFVKEVWIKVVVAAAGAGTPICTVGFVGNGETADPDAFLNNAGTDVVTTGTRSSKLIGGVAGQGKWFNSAAGVLTLFFDDGGYTLTTYPTIIVFMDSVIIH